MLAYRHLTTLTHQQFDFFEENGFLVLEGVVDLGQLDHLRTTLDDLIDRPADRRTPDFVVDKNSTTALRNINHFTRYWIAGAELIRNPVVLGAMRDLLGDDIRFHHTKVFLKPPFEGTAKEWHQDLNAYLDESELERIYARGADFDFHQAPLIAAQTYLNDSTLENGCLRFVPGSHRQGLINERIQPDRVREDFYPPERVVAAPARAGSVALFHSVTLHYSGPNQSAVPRRAPIVQYFAPPPPPTSFVLPPGEVSTPYGERLT